MKLVAKLFVHSRNFITSSAFETFLDLRVTTTHFLSYRSICQETFVTRSYKCIGTCKQIHSTAVTKSKVFSDGENNYAHTVFERLPVYSRTLAPDFTEKKIISEDDFQEIIKKDWRDDTVDAVYKAFETVSQYVANNPHDISNHIFDNLCENLAVKCEEMTDENLLGTLRCLSLWPMSESVDTPNFAQIWRSIDKECVKRIKTWDLDKVLFASDHWYKLFLVRKSDFVWHANFKLGKKPTRLLPYQLIQCMFYINVYRRWHPECNKYDFEYSVEKCLDKLTLNEIGIFAMGCFKSQTKIRNPLLISEIVARTMSELDSVHSITLAALLKVIRYSLTPSHNDMLYHLMDKLQTQIPRLSLLCLVHIALVGTNVQVYHKDLMRSISQRFCDEIRSARLKDMERFALSLTQYDYDPKTNPCIYTLILEELQNPVREQEIQQHPKCLSCCLYYLSLRNIYHTSLIDRVLQREFVINAYGKNQFHYGRELLALDVGVELECPEYKGSRLAQKTRQMMAKNITHWVPSKEKKKHSQTDRFMLEVMDTLENILGGFNNLHALHVLPQYERADIIFGLKDTGKPSNIPNEFKQLPLDTVKPPPIINGVKWYAVVICGWNLFIRGENRPVGGVAAKIRQLEGLGYIPIVVSWFDWCELHENQKKELLKSMISGKQLVRSARQC